MCFVHLFGIFSIILRKLYKETYLSIDEKDIFCGFIVG